MESLYLDNKPTELNDYITHIGSSAFRYSRSSTNLPDDGRMKIAISKLPSNLITLGSSAFFMGGPNVTINTIPPNVEKISSWTFYYCTNLNITQLGSNDSITDSKLHTIEAGAFSHAGQNVTSLTFGSTITDIYKDESNLTPLPFLKYGVSEIQINTAKKASIIWQNAEHTKNWSSYIDMGFSSNAIVVESAS